jgi:hypothetical protein
LLIALTVVVVVFNDNNLCLCCVVVVVNCNNSEQGSILFKMDVSTVSDGCLRSLSTTILVRKKCFFDTATSCWLQMIVRPESGLIGVLWWFSIYIARSTVRRVLWSWLHHIGRPVKQTLTNFVELAAPCWAAGEADSLFTRLGEVTVPRPYKIWQDKWFLGGCFLLAGCRRGLALHLQLLMVLRCNALCFAARCCAVM